MRPRSLALVASLSLSLVLPSIMLTTAASPAAADVPAPAAPAPTRAAPAVRKVAIVVYDQAELLDFAGPAEVLSAAGGFAGQGRHALDVYLVARSKAPVTVQGFVAVVPQYSIDDAPRPDIVVIPGGNSARLTDDPAMVRWLTATTGDAEATLTVCTGAMALARTGALDGLEITTWYGAIERLQQVAPKSRVVHGRRFIDNGRFITTAGVSAGIDGALHLTARLFGRRVADQTARYMEYHWTPEPYLAVKYAYWNPSLDDHGRALQQAAALAEEGRADDAIAAYRKLTAADRDGRTWVTLGDLQLQRGDLRGAIASYRHVGAASPVFAWARYNLACAHARSGDRKAALTAITEALAAGADRTQALADPDLEPIRAALTALPAS